LTRSEPKLTGIPYPHLTKNLGSFLPVGAESV